MPTQRKNIIFNLILKIAAIAIAISLASWFLLTANGYVVDLRNFRIDRVGVLAIKTDPENATIKINDRLTHLSTFQNYINLFPGRYSVEISAPGYQTWYRSFEVNPNKAVIFEDVVLFLEKVEKVNERTITTTSEQVLKASDNLLIDDREIWLKDPESDKKEKLISRFSYPVKAAILVAETHVFYQVNKEIHVIDIDGSNDKKLVILEMDEPAHISVTNNLKILSVVSDGVISDYKIH